jgi:hypothetical protein
VELARQLWQYALNESSGTNVGFLAGCTVSWLVMPAIRFARGVETRRRHCKKVDLTNILPFLPEAESHINEETTSQFSVEYMDHWCDTGIEKQALRASPRMDTMQCEPIHGSGRQILLLEGSETQICQAPNHLSLEAESALVRYIYARQSVIFGTKGAHSECR